MSTSSLSLAQLILTATNGDLLEDICGICASFLEGGKYGFVPIELAQRLCVSENTVYVTTHQPGKGLVLIDRDTCTVKTWAESLNRSSWWPTGMTVRMRQAHRQNQQLRLTSTTKQKEPLSEDKKDPSSAVVLARPFGVAVDDTNIYVVNNGHNRVYNLNKQTGILKFRSNDKLLSHPCGIAMDEDRIYVADTGNNQIQIFDKKTGLGLMTYSASDERLKGAHAVAVDTYRLFVLTPTSMITLDKITATTMHIWNRLEDAQDIALFRGQIYVTDICTSDPLEPAEIEPPMKIPLRGQPPCQCQHQPPPPAPLQGRAPCQCQHQPPPPAPLQGRVACLLPPLSAGLVQRGPAPALPPPRSRILH